MAKTKTDYSEFEDEYSTPPEIDDNYEEDWGVEDFEEDENEEFDLSQLTESDELENIDDEYEENDFIEDYEDEYETSNNVFDFTDEEESNEIFEDDDESELMEDSDDNELNNDEEYDVSDSGEDDENDTDEREEVTSLKDLGNSIIGKFKSTKESIDLDKFFSSYDSVIEKIALGISKVPLLGKIVEPFTKSKVVFRLFPFIIIAIIITILVSISYITGPSKTSSIPLPDLGEITVESIQYNKDSETMTVEMTNTGGVIIPVEERLTLYSYNPSINPLSLARFEEVGTCEIPETVVNLEETTEMEIDCIINEGSKVNYRVTAVYNEAEEE